MFTSPIVISSVTRPLDDVFEETGDEGELVEDMGILSSVIQACTEVSPMSRALSFFIHSYKEKRNRLIINEMLLRNKQTNKNKNGA